MKKSMKKAKAEHQKFLERMGVANLKPKKRRPLEMKPFKSEVEHIPSEIKMESVCTKRKTNSYSGELGLLGIATMHKSCLQPVWTKEQAKDSAKMRRA